MEFHRTIDDIWRHTLSQIPTLFGRLEYLSTIRNPHTGRYEHFGLEQSFGAEQSDMTLRLSHERLFADWVAFPLEAQKRELQNYLSGREETAGEVIESWLRVKPFATWVPANTRNAERTLFLTDLDLLMELLRRELGVGAPDPDA